jgi:hypothetical protein
MSFCKLEVIKRGVKRQRFRLWLLALVLALALAWYTLNPVPGTAQLNRREEDPPDAKQRQAQAQTAGDLLVLEMEPAFRQRSVREASFEELSGWPAYLDLD